MSNQKRYEHLIKMRQELIDFQLATGSNPAPIYERLRLIDEEIYELEQALSCNPNKSLRQANVRTSSNERVISNDLTYKGEKATVLQINAKATVDMAVLKDRALAASTFEKAKEELAKIIADNLMNKIAYNFEESHSDKTINIIISVPIVIQD